MRLFRCILSISSNHVNMFQYTYISFNSMYLLIRCKLIKDIHRRSAALVKSLKATIDLKIFEQLIRNLAYTMMHFFNKCWKIIFKYQKLLCNFIKLFANVSILINHNLYLKIRWEKIHTQK